MQPIIQPHLSELLPHKAPMVLIDSVTRWNGTAIECEANTHLAASNPLRINGVLSIYAGVEYAAQAMALHLRLNSQNTDQAPRKGFVAVASRLNACTQNLDDIQAPLHINLQQLVVNDQGALFQFNLSASTQELLQGQLLAVLAAE